VRVFPSPTATFTTSPPCAAPSAKPDSPGNRVRPVSHLYIGVIRLRPEDESIAGACALDTVCLHFARSQTISRIILPLVASKDGDGQNDL
jgi:hypothetical protein